MDVQIRRLREERGLSQAQLGDAIGGVSARQIGYWETGKVSLDNAVILADFFGVTLDELAGRRPPYGKSREGLSREEGEIVVAYRNMDPEQQATYRNLAGTFVLASEKDAARDRADVAFAGDVSD